MFLILYGSLYENIIIDNEYKQMNLFLVFLSSFKYFCNFQKIWHTLDDVQHNFVI